MKSADLVLLNGNIITLDASKPSAQALAAYGGKIVYVGNNEQARELAGAGTKVVDLGGKTALPGFNDGHLHLSMYGFELGQVDLFYPNSTCVADIQRLVADKVDQTPPGEWVFARGYDQTKLAEGRHISREELDEKSAGHPMVLVHCTGHAYMANSLALKLAGITRDSVPPTGGCIDKDSETGEPTGVIAETAMAILEGPMPKRSVEDQARAVALAARQFVSAGITSCGDMGASLGVPESHLAGYYLARERGELPLRCYVTIPDGFWEEASRVGIMPGLGDDWLRIGALKIFADGSLVVKTAALLEAYVGEPTNTGVDFTPPEVITEEVVKANAAGWQVAIHAVGDRAVHNALTAIETALARNPRKDARHRIEHVTTIKPEFVDRFVRSGVVPVMQPAFVYYYGDVYGANLGPDRSQYVKPFRTLLDRGLPVVGSSDCSVTPFSPLVGIKSAVVRDTVGGQRFVPNQAVTLDEALAMYTWRGAYATFEEKIKGTLSTGKLADVVILSEDPRNVAPQEIDKIRVEMTITGGQAVYEAPIAARAG